MPAIASGYRARSVHRDGLPFAALLVLAVASALTGAVAALVAQRLLQRRQVIEVLPQPAPVRSLKQPEPATVPQQTAASSPSPLASVGSSLSAKRVAELERLLVEDDVIAGDGTSTCPPEFPIKANGRSGIYHWPTALAYAQTRPTLCFRSAESADRAGFRPAKR